MGQVHLGIAQFSGMTVLGGNEGYLLGALIVAWVNWERWPKSFGMSYLSLIFANITYYGCILVFYFTGWGRSPFPPPPLASLVSFAMWSVIMAVVCALAATAVWMARRAKAGWLNYGIFAVSYVGLLGVVWFYRLGFFINWYNMTIDHSGFVVPWRVAGYVFEMVFAVVLITAVLAIGLRRRQLPLRTM